METIENIHAYVKAKMKWMKMFCSIVLDKWV